MTYLELSHIYKEFSNRKGPHLALQDVNLYLEKGEFVCVVGVSGSGKSSLLRLIAGIDRPTAGTVKVEGVPVTGPGPDRGLVFQSYTLYPWLTVARNVEFGLKLQHMPKAERQARVTEYLEIIGLTEFANAYPKELSGGMQQRVAIARSLVCQPKILLLDEPFGALDVQTKETMQQFILGVWQRLGITILMITHDIAEAVFLASRVYVLTKQPGTIQKVLKIDLPLNRTYKIKRDPQFQDYCDEIADLLRCNINVPN